MVGYHQRKFEFGDRASYARLYPHLSQALESGRIVAEAKKSKPGAPRSQFDRPAQVIIKRKHNSADVGVGDDNRLSLKAARVESSTDAASSRTLHRQDPEVEEDEDA
ncbi:hypothetical protein M407DRAFT_244746, partial [Tulasnella calospora MUT 4182]